MKIIIIQVVGLYNANKYFSLGFIYYLDGVGEAFITGLRINTTWLFKNVFRMPNQKHYKQFFNSNIGVYNKI